MKAKQRFNSDFRKKSLKRIAYYNFFFVLFYFHIFKKKKKSENIH